MHPDNLCASEWNLFEDNRLPVCLVGAAETAAPPIVSVRRPIGFRPPSNRFPSAVRLDSVRRPIGFRPPSDWFPSAIRSVFVRRPIGFRPPSDWIPFAARR